VLADGGHDDYKHDPVDNVYKTKGHDCPSIKWPFFCSAADEGGGERERKKEKEREGGREGGREVERENGHFICDLAY
jgi:hypothetical protein